MENTGSKCPILIKTSKRVLEGYIASTFIDEKKKLGHFFLDFPKEFMENAGSKCPIIIKTSKSPQESPPITETIILTTALPKTEQGN